MATKRDLLVQYFNSAEALEQWKYAGQAPEPINATMLISATKEERIKADHTCFNPVTGNTFIVTDDKYTTLEQLASMISFATGIPYDKPQAA